MEIRPKIENIEVCLKSTSRVKIRLSLRFRNTGTMLIEGDDVFRDQNTNKNYFINLYDPSNVLRWLQSALMMSAHSV